MALCCIVKGDIDMIEFQLTENEYVNTMRALMRRRLLIATPAIFGSLWIVSWILFAIAEGDAWSGLGTVAILLLVGSPLTALVTSIRMMAIAKSIAKKTFQTMSFDGIYLYIQCQLEDGQLKYYNASRDKMYEIDLKNVKKVSKFKDFFVVELSKSIGYVFPLKLETELLYHRICEQIGTKEKDKCAK